MVDGLFIMTLREATKAAKENPDSQYTVLSEFDIRPGGYKEDYAPVHIRHDIFNWMSLTNLKGREIANTQYPKVVEWYRDNGVDV